MSLVASQTIGAALALTMLASACKPTQRTEPHLELPEISAVKAKELVLERYKLLYSDKSVINPIDKKCYPMPALAIDLMTISNVDGTWHVRVEPPSGISLQARVDKHGRWTEIAQGLQIVE